MPAVARVDRSTKPAGPQANGWTGTVTLVAYIDRPWTYKDPYGVPETRSGSYHEKAVYTLAGETTPEGLQLAQMTGSGTGRETRTGGAPRTCPGNDDPLYEWSYSGQASVRVSYTDGRFIVWPQRVTTEVRTVTHFACPDVPATPDLTYTRQTGVPLFITGFGQVAAPESATSITGTESFPIRETITGAGQEDQTAVTGTTTLTWDLHRAGAASTGVIGNGSGTVLVDGKPYTSGQPIPYGSTVDVTNGRLALKTDVGTLTVYGAGVSAVFMLLRSSEKGKPLVELRLVKGDFSVCRKTAVRTTSARKPPGKTVRRLWAKGKGAFRTRGRYSASTVRGTFWLTADRCDGTLTQVKQGQVEVLDLIKKKRVTIKAGQSYLAAPRKA